MVTTRCSIWRERWWRVFNPAIGEERPKTGIVRVDTAASGPSIHECGHIGYDARFRGVMAQDVLADTPGAVITHPSGCRLVDCAMLGKEMTRIQ